MNFDVIIGHSAFVEANAEHFATEYSKLLAEKQANTKASTDVESTNKEIYIRKQK